MICDGVPVHESLVIAYSVFSGILFITSIYSMIIFIKNHQTKLSKCLFYFAVLFCIVTSINLIVSTIFYPFALCADATLDIVEHLLLTYFCSYFIHINLFYLILFMKLYFVFKGSAYKMGKVSVIFWVILFIISPCLYISWLFLWKTPGIMFIDIIVIWFWGIMIPLILAISFISKLLKVYKSADLDVMIANDTNNDEDALNDKMLSVITKNTILTLLSLPFTIVIVPVLVLVDQPYIIGWITLFDVYTNFICIIFSYQLFSKYYMKLCGFVDMKCRKCFHRIANKNKKGPGHLQMLIDPVQ